MLENIKKKWGLKSEPSIFHLHIMKMIKEKVNYPYVDTIDVSTANTILWHYNVPKKCRHNLLKEMEQLELIKFKNRRKIEILNNK